MGSLVNTQLVTSVNKKGFWKSVKSLNKNRENIPILKSGDSVVASNKDKANLLNNFFAKSAEQPLTERMYAVNNSDTYYGDSTVSPDEVLHIIYGLDINKANGPDAISAYMLKATAESIVYSIIGKTFKFSLSLSSGKFLVLWKSASIVPIPKSTSKSDYRPISIVSKLLERYVYSLLWKHMVEHAPLSDSQWGFQKESPLYYYHYFWQLMNGTVLWTDRKM